MIAAYHNENRQDQQPHYEHYIVVEDEQLVQSQQQREAYQLGLNASKQNRGDSIIKEWDRATGSKTPKFSEQRVQKNNLNIKLQKHKKASGTSQQRMTSDPEITPRKKIVTKSQATDTQLEGVYEKGKPNSVDANKNEEEMNQSYLGLEQDNQPTVTLRASETPQALMSDNQVNVMMMPETLMASNNPETIVVTTDEQNVHQTCLNSSIQSPNINKEDNILWMQDIPFEVPDVPKPPPLPKITIEDILALLPPPSEFSNKVKQIHKILPQNKTNNFLQSPENPSSIVESTLQAISLTKQH